MSNVKTGGHTVNQSLRVVHTAIINIDNGAATTADFTLFRPTTAITIHSMSVVYTTATAGTVAGATVQVGTSVGGSQIVAAVALTNGSTVGSAQSLALVIDEVAADTPIIVRHTGIAATAAGEYIVQMEFAYDA